MAFSAGDRVGRYVVEGLLGEGAMGRVYRAHDEQLERPVALKVLRVDEDDAEDARERAGQRLLREARAAATLEHPNAVVIHEVGEAFGQPYLAMELVLGASLRSYVGDGSVPIATRMRWLHDVARALGAAHARGIVHRDVKPENVMLRKDGVIKVLDFGIARRAGGEPGGPPSSGEGHETGIAGTPRYMAPEQLRGDPFDGRADQFAWGVMAYELLLGRAPWAGSAVSFSLIATITSDEPVSLDELIALGVPRFVGVVARALAKDPNDRFATMEELAAAIEPALRDAPPTRPPPPPVPPKRWSTLWVVAAALGLALLGGGALARHRLTAAPGGPIRLVDLPPPETASAEARGAYTEGVTAIGEGSVVPGLRALNRAIAADAGLAAAHLRCVAYGKGLSEVDGRARFESAWSLRERLTPRDRELLTALAPGYLSLPADEAEVTKRLDELARSHPNDAELVYLAAAREADPTRIAARLDAVIALDPEFSLAIWRKATAELVGGELEASAKTLDRCVATTPSSTACLSVRALVEEALGRCDGLERDARLLEARSPSARTHDWVARALVANGAPEDSVRQALGRKWAAASDAEREGYRLVDEAHLAILKGDFVAAERDFQALGARIEKSVDEDEHKVVTLSLLDLYDETGDVARAAQVADAHLRARAGWQSIGAWSMTPIMWAAAVRGGLRAEAERAAARDAWLASWKTEPLSFAPQAWVFGWAQPSETEAEAREAVAHAPATIPRTHTNQFNRYGFSAPAKAFLLGGAIERARPLVREAAAACSALPAPVEHLRAQLWLGQSLEAIDVPGACAAYARVLAAWGNARPRSVSAERARERIAALGCPR